MRTTPRKSHTCHPELLILDNGLVDNSRCLARRPHSNAPDRSYLSPVSSQQSSPLPGFLIGGPDNLIVGSASLCSRKRISGRIFEFLNLRIYLKDGSCGKRADRLIAYQEALVKSRIESAQVRLLSLSDQELRESERPCAIGNHLSHPITCYHVIMSTCLLHKK